ncbi:MAG: hypothetical protein ACOC9J_00020 [Persicimonas sp.]
MMLRSIWIFLAAAGLILLTFGCDKKTQRTDDDAPAETGTTTDDAPEDGKPDADFPVADQDFGESEPDADATNDQPDAHETTQDGQPQACPEPREAQGMCAQVITWALNPETGDCCQYSTPCEAPEDWETFSSEAECKQAAE